MRLDKVLDDLMNDKLMNTHVGFIGKITGNVKGASVISSGKMCDVQPLFKYKEIGGAEQTPSIIKNVPISQSVRKIEIYQYEMTTHIVEHPTHEDTEEEHLASGILTKSDESKIPLESNVYGGNIKIVPFEKDDIVVCLCCDRNIDDVRKGELSLPSAASMHRISNCVVIGYLVIE